MLRVYFFPMIIILYIVSEFLPNSFLALLVGVFANVAILISLFYARGLYLYSGISFYAVGMVLFLTNDLSWQDFFLQFDTMLGILALFFLLPFLNSLIVVGRYDSHLRTLLQHKVGSVGDLYARSTIVTHILGLFLNIATIPLLLKSLHASLKDYSTAFSNVFYARSLLRAYALCLMWSPMEIMIIQTLEITGKSYLALFPFLIFFTVSVLIGDMYSQKRKYGVYAIHSIKNTVSLSTIFSKIRELMILLVILVFCVSILNQMIQQGYLFSLVLLIIPISIGWAHWIGKAKRYFLHTIPHWKSKTKGLADYFFMFLCAGFFVNMIAHTKVLDMVQSKVITHSHQTLLVFLFIGIYFVVTSYLGFHPLVSIVLLGEILRPVISEITSISLALVLITCSLSTVMYSPFNVTLSILASEIKFNLYRVGFWNLPFAIVFMLISISFAYLIHLILLIL
jgi:hypothetical protein